MEYVCPTVVWSALFTVDTSPANKNELAILLKEKFKSERGRINCSLWEEGGKWRWLGIQYVIEGY